MSIILNSEFTDIHSMCSKSTGDEEMNAYIFQSRNCPDSFGSTVTWPPRSPDPTPLDFFVGYRKLG